jgi:hypothetical protein
MNMRRFSPETQRSYIRDVGRFATFLSRSPDTATAEDLRRFQVEQREAGVPAPTMNSIVSALRFFFTHTLDRPDLAGRPAGLHPTFEGFEDAHADSAGVDQAAGLGAREVWPDLRSSAASRRVSIPCN